jgi:hypothetical protein
VAVRAVRAAEEPAEETKQAKEEGAAPARKGPRRRGRRGGRRGRSEQRPQRAPGEEAPSQARTERRAHDDTARSIESAEGQNGSGRKPQTQEATAREVAQPSYRDAEPVFESVTTVGEEPAKPSEARPEDDGERKAPRRRGWWLR